MLIPEGPYGITEVATKRAGRKPAVGDTVAARKLSAFKF